MSDTSISRRLTRQFIMLGMGPLIFISLLIPFDVYTSQKEQSLSRQYQIAANLGVRSEAFFKELEYVLNRAALDLGEAETTQEKKEEIISELLSYNNAFQFLALLDAEGMEKFALHYSRTILDGELKSQKNSPVVRDALANKRITLGNARYDEGSQEPLIKAVVPIVNIRTGAVEVFIAADVRLKKIWDTVADVSIDNDVEAYILDKTGIVIAHTDQSIVLKGTQVPVDQQDGLVKGLNDDYVLLSVERFVVANKTFFIHIEKPAKEALSGAIKVTFYIALMIMIAVIFAGLLISRARKQIVTPLRQLTDVVKDIIDGKRDRRVAIRQDDEIGELAQSFNEMTDRNLKLLLETEQAERKYRAIFENAVEGLFQTTVEGQFLNVNPALSRMLGYDSPQDLMDNVKNIRSDVHVNQDQRPQFIERFLEGAEIETEDILCKCKNGDHVWVKTTIQAVRNIEGRILYLEGSAEDITQKKHLDELLRQASEEEKLQGEILRHSLRPLTLDHYVGESLDIILQNASLFGAMDKGAIFINDNPEKNTALRLVAKQNFPPQLQASCSNVEYGVCLCGRAAQTAKTLFSHGSSEKLELSPEEFKSYGHFSMPIVSGDRTIGVLLLLFAEGTEPTETQRYFVERLCDVLSMGISRRLDELAIQRLNENLEIRVQERTSELDEANKALEAVAEKAEEANKAKSTFLSQMSHELRTPLNGILGFAQLIQLGRGKQEWQKVDQYSSQIMSAGKHLLDLINEILDLAKIESGRMSLSIEKIDVHSVIDEVLDLIGPVADQYKIKLSNSSAIKNETVMIDADFVRLKQVIMNLASNAIKYNRENGSVEIHVDRDDKGQILISLIDSGIGISPEAIEKLFIPFDRLDADQTEIEGTGIGLTITQKLVELMNGSISVESEVGVGSTFTLSFPLSTSVRNIKPLKGEADNGEETAGKKNGSGEKTVLYVEDNPANQSLMLNVFETHLPHELHIAVDGQSSVELARALKPGLILLDIHLPDMSGYDVYKILQKYDETSDIPVIAVSANAMPADIRKGVDLGFKEYLTKPLDIPKTVKCIKQYLEN